MQAESKSLIAEDMDGLSSSRRGEWSRGGERLTARRLLRDGCALAGTLEKHASRLGPLADLLPCACDCLAQWKSRFFVVKGAFLFRFTAEDSAVLKGTPTSLLDARFRICEDPLPAKRAPPPLAGAPPPRAFVAGEGGAEAGVEADYAAAAAAADGGDAPRFCFEVWTLRKVVVLRAPSHAARTRWIATLRRRKQRAIKEAMGHAPLSPSARASNDAARELVRKRQKRERDAVEKMQSESLGTNGVGRLGIPSGGGGGGQWGL